MHDRLRNFVTLLFVNNFGRFCHFNGKSQTVSLFLANFQALIVYNFGTLKLLPVLFADTFGILALFQVLIAKKLGMLITSSGFNCGQVLWE